MGCLPMYCPYILTLNGMSKWWKLLPKRFSWHFLYMRNGLFLRLMLLLVHSVCIGMYCCCHWYTVGAQLIHKKVLLLSLVHGGCTVDVQKGIVVAASTWWVHRNVLFSLVDDGSTNIWVATWVEGARWALNLVFEVFVVANENVPIE